MYHIVIITSYPFPGFAATSNRVMALANTLSSIDGIKVSVIGPGSDIKTGKNIMSGLPFEIKSINVENFTGTNLFYRAFSELKQFLSLKSLTIKSSPDLVIITIPSIFLLGIKFFVKKGTAVVIDIRDLVWEYFIKKSLFYKIIGNCFKIISIAILKKVSKVIVTNEKEFNVLNKKHIKPLIIRNGLDRKRFEQLSHLKKVNKLDTNRINITYAGNVGLAQKLDTLIDLTRKHYEIQTTIIGDGKDLPRLKEYVNQFEIKNISFTGKLSWDDLILFYEKTDIFYVQIGKEFTTAVPSKIFEYVATGRIVIISAPDGPATQLADIFENVKAVEPENPIQLGKLFKSILVKQVR